mgnify:CR=1 FL=1|tara:strand:+ start:416 stop:661 length:246 start_codon:yes stop_codon:yes gene_type:complete
MIHDSGFYIFYERPSPHQKKNIDKFWNEQRAIAEQIINESIREQENKFSNKLLANNKKVSENSTIKSYKSVTNLCKFDKST